MSNKCESTTKPSQWWDKENIEFPDCIRGATVEIDGVKMCMQHAGQIAIQILINESRCKYIDTAARDRVCKLDEKWAGYVKGI